MKKLIIFADYGLDDAAATATIFNHHQCFEKIFIVPIGGNVPPEVSMRNCNTILMHYPEAWEKVTIVDATHISQPSEYLADIHGKDGMGDVFEPFLEQASVERIKYEEWLESLCGDEVVLSLGPMTLVSPLMKKAPFELIIMGGCVDEEPNFKGYEFNHSLDREAFSFCTKFPHAAITLDTCRVEKLDVRKLEVCGDDVHSRVLRADQELSITRGEDGCYVWDDVAACFLLFPERFKLVEKTDKDGNRLFNAEYISDKLYYMD